MIILGIDPGSRKTGFAFIDNKADSIALIHSGFIAVKGEQFPERLAGKHKDISLPLSSDAKF